MSRATPEGRLYLHVGFPKTATTTFQTHVFPHHPEIDYLGKLIPGYRYRDPRLFEELERLTACDELRYEGGDRLRAILDEHRASCRRRALLISSESFLSVTAVDPAIVARRLITACAPCKVIITIREQIDSIKSFYGLHGRFGQYLFLCPNELESVRFPLSLDRWLSLAMRAYNKNYLSLLHYYETISYYQRLVGRENVGVFLFEEFVRDKPAYVRQLSEFLGVDAGTTMTLLDGKHELPNLSRLEWLCVRLLAALRLSRAAGVGDPQRWSAVRRWIAGGGRARIEMSEPWRHQVSALYRDGNRLLMKELGLALDRYQYAV